MAKNGRRALGLAALALVLSGCAGWTKCAGPWQPQEPVDLILAVPLAGCAIVKEVQK